MDRRGYIGEQINAMSYLHTILDSLHPRAAATTQQRCLSESRDRCGLHIIFDIVMVSLFTEMFKCRNSKNRCKLHINRLHFKNPFGNMFVHSINVDSTPRTKVSQKNISALIHSLRSNSVLRFFTSVLGIGIIQRQQGMTKKRPIC